MLELSNFFHESEELNVERNEKGPEFLRNLFFTKKLEARNYTDGNQKKMNLFFFVSHNAKAIDSVNSFDR